MNSKEQELLEKDQQMKIWVGDILSGFTMIEDQIEFTLTKYFAEIGTDKGNLINEIIVEHNFEWKKQRLKKVCNSSKIDVELVKNVFDSINELQHLRNRAAHCSFYADKENTYLLKNKHIIDMNEAIPLNEETIDRFEKHIKVAFEGLIDIQKKLGLYYQTKQDTTF